MTTISQKYRQLVTYINAVIPQKVMFAQYPLQANTLLDLWVVSFALI